MNLRGFAIFFLMMAGAGSALADDGLLGFCGWLRSLTRASECPCLGGAPDDYCRKCCPALTPPSSCGVLDDYCRKNAPCLTDVSHCGSPDEYCRKCIPCLLCPPSSPYLHHGTGERCCMPAQNTQ